MCNLMVVILTSPVIGVVSVMPQGGLICAMLTMVFGVMVASEMTRVICETLEVLEKKKCDVSTYIGFATHSMGTVGRYFATLSSSISFVAFPIIGMVTITQNLECSLPITLPGLEGRQWWAVLLMLETLLYVSLDIRHILSETAALAPVTCVTCVALACAGGAIAIRDKQTIPAACQTVGDRSYYSLGPDMGNLLFHACSSIATITAYGFYNYAVIVTLPALRSTMAEPQHLVGWSIAAFVTTAVMYIIIMVIGYVGFGNLAPSSLVRGMTQDRPPGWWALNAPWETGRSTTAGRVLSLTISINIILNDGLYVPAAALQFDKLLEQVLPARIGTSRNVRVLQRVFYVALRTAVSIAVFSFVYLTSFIVSTLIVADNIFFPLAAFYATRSNVHPLRKTFHVMILCFGLFVMVYGSWASLLAMSNGEPSPPGSFLRSDLSDACAREYSNTVQPVE